MNYARVRTGHSQQDGRPEHGHDCRQFIKLTAWKRSVLAYAVGQVVRMVSDLPSAGPRATAAVLPLARLTPQVAAAAAEQTAYGCSSCWKCMCATYQAQVTGALGVKAARLVEFARNSALACLVLATHLCMDTCAQGMMCHPEGSYVCVGGGPPHHTRATPHHSVPTRNDKTAQGSTPHHTTLYTDTTTQEWRHAPDWRCCKTGHCHPCSTRRPQLRTRSSGSWGRRPAQEKG